MTLKELVMKIDFEVLLPYLKKHEAEHLDNIYAFREAYDILREMKPAKDFQGEIHVAWSGGEIEDEEKWINVGSMHDASWEEDLAKEIVVAGDVHLSSEELAMHCLWEITYWGFSPEDMEDTFTNMVGRRKAENKYEMALDKLHESIWKHQTPCRLRARDENGELRTIMEFPLKNGQNKRMNRSKRKREYRQDRRKDYLEKMASRENLVRMITIENSSFKRSDVEFLLHITYGIRYEYLSVTHGSDNRLAYILESMTEYQQLDLSQYDSALVSVYVSSRYSLEETELEGFKKEVYAKLGYKDLLFGTIVQNADRKNVKVMLLLIKRER